MANLLDGILGLNGLGTPSTADQEQLAQIAQDPAAAQAAIIGLDRGNEVITQNQILTDSQSLTAAEFLGKYGTDAASQISNMEQAGRSVPLTNANTRTPTERITDFGVGVGSGVVQSVGGAGAMLAGAVNQDAGLAVSEALGNVQDFTSSLQSHELNLARRVDAIKADLDSQSNKILYDRDIAAGNSEFEASLKSFGRDALGGLNRFIEDPTTLEDGLAQGVGSLLAGGPIARGISVATGGAVAVTSAMPAAIALMEGGNAYSGTTQEVMGMSYDELSDNSPDYRRLVDSGVSAEDAKRAVAHKAGQIAMAVQAPIAAASGRLVAKFEADPLSAKTFGGMVRNILNETTEEGIQSLTGELAGNLGIQLSADENQALLEGVGAATAQGALLGSLTAGVIQAPTVPANAARAGIDAIKGRAETIQAANEAGSGVTDADLTAQAASVAEVVNAAPDIVQAVVDNTPADVREATGADSMVQRVTSALAAPAPEEYASLGPDMITHLVENEGAPQFGSRTEMLLKMGNIAGSENLSQEVRAAAGLFVTRELENQSSLFGSDIQEALNSMDQESDAYVAMSNHNRLLNTIANHPSVAAAIEFAKTAPVAVNRTEVPSQQTVANAVNTALVNPSNLTGENVDGVLYQADQGNIEITPAQRKAFQNVALIQAVQSELRQDAQASLLGDDTQITALADEVTQQLFTKKGPADWMLSVSDHVARVNQAVNAGDNAAATRALKHFGNLVASQRNKARATETSLNEGGRKVEFRALGSYGRVDPTPHTWGGTHAGNVNSMNLARRVFLEANALGKAYNALAANNPGLVPAERSVINPLVLPTALFGEPRNAAIEAETRREADFDARMSVETPPLPSVTTADVVTEAAPISVDNGATQTTETRFANLIKIGENAVNRFTSAFKMPKEMPALLTAENPLKQLRSNLNNMSVEDLDFSIDQDQKAAFGDYLEAGEELVYSSENGNLVQRLNDILNSPYSKKNPEEGTFADQLRKGKDLTQTAQGRGLAIVEEVNGQFQYNPALIETAMLAGLHWFAQRQNREIRMDHEDVAKLTGMNVADIHGDLVDKFNDGVGLTAARRALAETISDFWGLDRNRDASESYTKGIPEAIAAEILKVFVANGFMRQGNISTPNTDNGFIQFYFAENIAPNISATLKNMGPAKKLLAIEAGEKLKNQGSTYGKPPARPVASNQLRNPTVRNTNEQRRALKKAEALEFRFNETGYLMQRALKVEGLIRLAGSTIIEENTPFNQEHKKSVEGRNRTIASAFANLEEQYVEAMAFVGDDSIHDLKKFYEFNYSRVNRMQMLGTTNPQSDKLARNVWLPTRAVIDMNNDADALGFWQAVAQGIGIKTEYNTPQAAMDAAIAATLDDGPYSSLVQGLKDWIADGRTGDLTSWVDQALASNLKINEHAQLALQSVAEFLHAVDTGADLSKFVTFNFFEADGKTNGAANALGNFAGTVNGDLIDAMWQTGNFIGRADAVMSDNTKELYKSSGDRLTEIVGDTYRNLPENVKPIYDSMQRIMNGLGMKISLSDDGFGNTNLVVDRGVMKNPFTITIYRSGVDGIAGKVTNDLLDLMYEKISQHLQNDGVLPFGEALMTNGESYSASQFWTDMYSLIGNKVTREDDGNRNLSWEVATDAEIAFAKEIPDNTELSRYKMLPAHYETLKNNIRSLFVEDMVSAISDTVMGHVEASVDVVQKATNAQSIVLAAMFRKNMMRVLTEKRQAHAKNPIPGFNRNDALSQNEMDGILKSLLPYGAVINTGSQSYFLGAGERNDVLGSVTLTVEGEKYTVRMPRRFSLALDGSFETAAYAFTPGAAGVSGVPSLVIGTGDGRMIDLFMNTAKDFSFLPVFDGINLPVNRISEGSLQANTAVLQSWGENPMQHVVTSFEAFLRQNPLEQLFDMNDAYNTGVIDEKRGITFMSQFARELTQNFDGFGAKDVKGLGDLQIEFDHLLQTMTRQRDNIADRIAAEKELPRAVDQMAGGATPATQKGKIAVPANATADDVAALLNERIRARRLKREFEVTGSAISQGSVEFMRTFRERATLQTESGASVADLSVINAIRKTLNNKLSNTQREMLNASLSALEGMDYKVVFGLPSQLQSYEQTNFPNTYRENEQAYYGKIDTNNRVIYLANPSVETLSHELLHAATLGKMQAYYANSENLGVTDREAVERLEGLMGEWLANRYDVGGPAVEEAHRAAVSAIMGHLNNERPAEALNEFLAWSLSNQEIINVQKTMQVKNPRWTLLGQALSALKRLIWGHQKAPAIGNEMFSNIRFNARVLMATPTSAELLAERMPSVALFQSNSFGSNNRLTDLRVNFSNKMLEFISRNKNADVKVRAAEQLKDRQTAMENLITGQKMALGMSSAFNLTPQETYTLKAVNAALITSENLNTNALDRAQEIYDNLLAQMSPVTFMVNPKADPGSVEYSADYTQAEAKYNALVGINTTWYDAKDRSTLLPAFLAMAMVHEPLRQKLGDLKLTAKEMPKGWKADAIIDRIGFMFANGMSMWNGGDLKSKNIRASVDALTDVLLNDVGDQRSFVEQFINDKMDYMDNTIKSYVEKASDKAQKWADTVQNPIGSKVAKVLKVGAQLMTADGSKLLADSAISMANMDGYSVSHREALNEVIGRTESNAPFFDRISKTRTMTDRVRQQWREQFPIEIAKKFSRPLTEKEWAGLHTGLGQTDAAALFANYRRDRTKELLSSGSSRQAEITKLEGQFKVAVKDKAKQLAAYMVGGPMGKDFMPNAFTIAGVNRITEEGAIADLDNLITLYAIENLNQETKDSLADLFENEQAGMESLFGNLTSLRNEEVTKATGKGRVNAYKGFMKSAPKDGVNLIIAKKADHKALLGMGYIYTGDYVGSTADNNSQEMGYYFSPVNGRPKFNQGVIQTVRQTVFGVDPDTGYSVGALTAGRITNAQVVAQITARMGASRSSVEALRPIRNEKFQIIAYERMADPMQLQKLEPVKDMAKSMGVWRGRQTEELAAQQVNNLVVDDLFKLWKSDQSLSHKAEFVRVDTSRDPVIADAWSIIPKETKDYIKQVFGDEGFMIRRGDILDTIGARSASVGDLWTGNSRWKPVVQEEIQKLVTGLFGNQGYNYLTKAENVLQGVVTDAKVMIVIKSVVVPAANIVSNIYQLSIAGVPMRSILKGMKQKTSELNSYVNRVSMEMKLTNDLHAAEGREDTVEVRKLSSRIRTLQDSYKRMSIWPLIENGEFGAITEGGISQEDLAIANGGWSGFVDRMANKTPEPFTDAARYGMITRDTSLFKALSRATQYGDFLAKAVLYDDLQNRKGLNQKDALAYINEEFVNYNRFAGRQRAYLESMGLIWFYNFKLRSMKVAQRMLHEHPFRALLHTAFTPKLPGLGIVGSPIADNALTMALDGTLGRSVGPGQLFRAPSLNPWLELIN